MATPTPDTEVPRLIMVDDTDPSIEYSPPTGFTRDLTGTLDKMGQGGACVQFFSYRNILK